MRPSNEQAGARPRVSIKLKIWLSILLTAVIIIAAVWILLLMSMSDYYKRVRRDSFGTMLNSIRISIDGKGITGAEKDLVLAAGTNHICIVVARDEGQTMQVDALPYNCYIHGESGREREYILLTQEQSDWGRIREANDPDTGTNYFIGTIRSSTSWGIPYSVVVTQIVDSANDAVSAVEKQLIVISVALLVLATVIAFLVSRSLTKPLLKVTQAARKIADGSVNVAVDVKSNDEIGDLADNFNLMSREISRVNVLQKELVANISHDMRTPLTMIRGYAETIRDIAGDDPEERTRQLDIIIDESNRLSTLVSDVMDLSLMQAGQSKLNWAVFDITAKARDILGRFRLLEQTRGFEFVLEAAGPYLVSADEVRIEQVIYNLINNAVNHIGEEKRITLRIFSVNEEVQVQVADTGVGISKEDLPLIWDRYYKPYKKTGREMGTGLGLSIVKAILINHHSRFGVMSTLGKGSTFWFTLRRAE